MRHLLEIDDLTAAELGRILDLSVEPAPEAGSAKAGVALIFEMPSARTRNSAEMAAVQLGLHPTYIDQSELGFDTRETVEDITRTLACYHAIVCARVHDHHLLERMASTDAVPVVNMLSRDAHPLQALADVLTIRDEFGDTDDLTIAYLGHPNNVWRSLSLAAGVAGMSVRLATPEEHRPSEDDLARIKRGGTELVVTPDPFSAVAGADVVYTDKWVSMSDGEASGRSQKFAPFTVTTEVMAGAAEHAVFLHCLPAKRGAEVTSPVIDGPASRVWKQAENRMHTIRGLFSWLLEVAG